jgi:pyruvate,water dikinase
MEHLKMNTLIRRLQDVEDYPVSLVGGKGANLGRLMRMGLPVPPGFVVTVEAYRAFLAANNLTNAGPEALRDHVPDVPIPADIGAAILNAYQQLGVSSVAVRSSATAEDLAEASFAGQRGHNPLATSAARSKSGSCRVGRPVQISRIVFHHQR